MSADAREKAIAEICKRYFGPDTDFVPDMEKEVWDAAIEAAAQQIGAMIERYNSDKTLQDIIRTEACALKGQP